MQDSLQETILGKICCEIHFPALLDHLFLTLDAALGREHHDRVAHGRGEVEEARDGLGDEVATLDRHAVQVIFLAAVGGGRGRLKRRRC